MVIAIDDDDPQRSRYRSEVAKAGISWVKLVEAPRPSMKHGGVLNRWAPQLAETYDIVGSLNDDHYPRTIGWDTALRVSLEEMITGIAYPNDTVKGRRLPTSVALTSDIILALGYLAPPPLEHWFIDDFWLKLGHDIGRINYLDEIIVEHVHPCVGKADWDKTYAEGNADPQGQGERWRTYCASDYAGDLERVRSLLQ